MSCVVFLILLQASSAHVCALKLCCYELFHASCANMSMPCFFFCLWRLLFFGGKCDERNGAVTDIPIIHVIPLMVQKSCTTSDDTKTPVFLSVDSSYISIRNW